MTSDASARYLEPSGRRPLGNHTGFPVRTELLEVGDAVLLYSDGLIERPAGRRWAPVLRGDLPT